MLIGTGLVGGKWLKTEGKRRALRSSLIKEMGEIPYMVGGVCLGQMEESSSVALKT